MTSISPFQLIRSKQSGEELSPEKIRGLVDAYTRGAVQDYQMSAWLMAVYFQGMTETETFGYTQAMIESGRQMDFSHLPGFVVDKHSTGGVGDKISIILGPLLAACGCYVPMLSGRGLGHTGGTLDKLESIPGYQVDIPVPRFQQIVSEIGISMIGQTDDICPADRKIYALRDVTSTIASNPLICGSIMSKKIAEGIQGLVLDIKCGNGAFMTDVENARELAALLAKVGRRHGLKVSYSITNMNQPLGMVSGVFAEIRESIDVLQGRGPEDVRKLTLHLAEQALKMGGFEDASSLARTKLADGAAYEVFLKMVNAQGGDTRRLQKPDLHRAEYETIIRAPYSGYIRDINTYEMGMGIIALGGGRRVKTDRIDPTAGFHLQYKPGMSVQSGEPILHIFCSDEQKLMQGKAILESAVTFQEDPTEPQPLIIEVSEDS